MSVEEAGELRRAWAAVKENRASDEQFLLLMRQPPRILDHLKKDYDTGTSLYKNATT